MTDMANILPPTRVNCRIGDPREKLNITVSNPELNAINPSVSGLLHDHTASSSGPVFARLIASRVKLAYPAPSKPSARVVCTARLFCSRSVRHLAGTNAICASCSQDRRVRIILQRESIKVKIKLVTKTGQTGNKSHLSLVISALCGRKCGRQCLPFLSHPSNRTGTKIEPNPSCPCNVGIASRSCVILSPPQLNSSTIGRRGCFHLRNSGSGEPLRRLIAARDIPIKVWMGRERSSFKTPAHAYYIDIA